MNTHHVSTADLVPRDPRAQDRLARLLQDEMNRLLDRLAGALPEGIAAALAVEDPDLAARIEDEEGRLTDLRASLLDGYRRWGESLQALEDLWALRALKADRPERRPERRPDHRPEPRAERTTDRRAA